MGFRRLIDRVLDRGVSRDVRPYDAIVAAVNALEPSMIAAGSLRQVADALRARPDDDIAAEAFALVREAARRTIGLRAFDVQITGAAVMNEGNIAEMQTGEGKTLVAVFPAVLHALRGSAVHVLTVNDYLARRDAAWMGPVYELLGVTVGCVQQSMGTAQRRRAYAADVTYATANEVGFDHLRDHLAEDPDDVVQRTFAFGIVDEADSILIDEARIPLVIAGGETAASDVVHRACDVVATLEADVDWATDEHGRSVHLTDSGIDRVEAALECENLHDSHNLVLLTAVNQALHARAMLRRDVDYVVRDGAVRLVDELKGRIVERRRWPDGVQAAVEAKESLEVTREARILSSMTFQALVALYPGLAGMTGTAASSAEELRTIYGADVVVVPPNRPCVRVDRPDVVFTHLEAKEAAVVEEIVDTNATGRPVLVGTASVAESERVAAAVRARGVSCEVLNARDDEREAEIVARAGQGGAVTISTNMAGRGTDIRLGDGVDALSGLYLIGTNRHASVRIDNQLRGRAGRQGDPGESRFFVSLEDPLVQQFARELRDAFDRFDGPLEDPSAARDIVRAQAVADAMNYQARQNLWRYGKLVEEQRRIVHRRRDDVLFGRSATVLPAERFDAFARIAGEDAVRDAERRATLFHLDELWEDHLAVLADVREGIHLASLGRLDTYHEYRKRAVVLFGEAYASVDRHVIETLERAALSPDGIALDIVRPGATWSYLLGDDRPALTGDWYRMFKGVKDRLTRNG